MELSPNDTIERWIVRRRLGKGGMADVFLVEHAQLGSMHALKIMSGATSTDRARLLAEGRAQAALQHPNLVLAHDMLEVGDEFALVMDYVDGPTLGVWVDEERPLTELMGAFQGIIAGVRFAHSNGFVHRDLKPANVLLELSRGDWRPRIIDFGLVKAVGGDEEEGVFGLTQPGTMMGTPEYMAPEQVFDASTVGAEADMWALGALLYRMVCGIDAFPTHDSVKTLNAVVRAEYPDPREHNPSLPDEIVWAINGLLVVNREDRIPDCETLLKVLGMEPDPEGVADRWKTEAPADMSQTWPGADEREFPETGAAASPSRMPVMALVVVGGLGLAAIALALLVAVAF